MNRRSRVLTYLCLLAAIVSCSLWVLSIFVSQKGIYVSSDLRRLLSAMGQPQFESDFVGRNAAFASSVFDGWCMTFVLDDDYATEAIGVIDSGTCYTAALCKGAFVVNEIEVSHTIVVGSPDEVSIGITNSFDIPLWLIMLLAMIFPIYQVLPMTKRRRRRRSGLCENCGYDLRGSVSGTCSECGVAFLKRQ